MSKMFVVPSEILIEADSKETALGKAKALCLAANVGLDNAHKKGKGINAELHVTAKELWEIK